MDEFEATLKKNEGDVNHPPQQEKITLQLSTEDLPGTWLGITTKGDLVALTNYRETMEYMAQSRPVKLSRGKVCGEYLIHRAVTAASAVSSTPSSDAAALTQESSSSSCTSATERWFRKRAQGWEDEFEGLNLLVVQNGGDRQVVGGNREGSGLAVFAKDRMDPQCYSLPKQQQDPSLSSPAMIVPGSVVGVSNSTFARPWRKVEIGAQALERTLNQGLELFGTGHRAMYNDREDSGETMELAWLVIQMLKVLRENTLAFSIEETRDVQSMVMALRSRVFVPKISFGNMGGPQTEYGTRSSTVVLFGRERPDQEHGPVAVFVEKIWYGPRDETTGERVEYSPESVEGLVWWQGRVGQDKSHWQQIQGVELEMLIRTALQIQAEVQTSVAPS
ncbi:hypothetical protein BGZ83_011521 [Gryganskiella cystojenkinii]|nr:hypothetical protein BGZ83_011521 [Gryganskiella cystojenkinii]